MTTEYRQVDPPADSRHRVSRSALLVEILVGLTALFLALVISAVVAGSASFKELMFLDGDSMAVPLFVRSLREGTAQDWAMSPVLFVPETAQFLVLSLTGLDIQALQFISAVVNFFLLYVAFRSCAVGARRGASAAIAAYVAFCVLVLLESAAAPGGLQLAGLVAMTTYYVGTVLGVILTVGIARRLWKATQHRVALPILLTSIASVSTFTNPLYVAWATLPLTVVLLVVGWLLHRLRRAAFIAALVVAGSALGYVLRLPLRGWIVAEAGNYFQQASWQDALTYDVSLLDAQLSSPSGITWTLINAALMLLGIVLTVLMVRRRRPGPASLAAFSWFAPLAVTAGFLLLGTETARYLQPVAFAPALSLIVLIGELPPARGARRGSARVIVPTVAATLAALAALLALPGAIRAATVSDASLTCAVNWVNGTDRVGAGQFWSVRAVKTHAESPAQLIQVDNAMNGYAWLVDRADFAQKDVSYLVLDDRSYPFTLPAASRDLPYRTVECGRYRILDYGNARLPIGPIRF